MTVECTDCGDRVHVADVCNLVIMRPEADDRGLADYCPECAAIIASGEFSLEVRP